MKKINNLNKNKKLIKHVAIIMDGNGRWATNKGKNRSFGHKAGVKSVINSINTAIYFNLKALTLYAFSSENWGRPKKEVSYLINLFVYSLKNKINNINNKNIRLKIFGEKKGLSKELQKYIHNSEEITKNNTGLILNIAINYGGKWDLIQCFKKIINRIQNNLLSIDDINESVIDNYICFNDSPPVDLLIRTGGDLRISNFLLWQLAYSELYFTKVLWPDFNKNVFKEALISFYNRTRKFGKII